MELKNKTCFLFRFVLLYFVFLFVLLISSVFFFCIFASEGGVRRGLEPVLPERGAGAQRDAQRRVQGEQCVCVLLFIFERDSW